MTRFLLSCLVLLVAASCTDSAPRHRSTGGDDQGGDIRAQVAGDMTATRLKIAEERIVQLERQVGELENTPEKLDLQLLTQRVEQLEAHSHAEDDPRSSPAPAAQPNAQPTRPEPRATPTPTGNRFNPFGL